LEASAMVTEIGEIRQTRRSAKKFRRVDMVGRISPHLSRRRQWNARLRAAVPVCYTDGYSLLDRAHTSGRAEEVE
jgi:hypothetical protein